MYDGKEKQMDDLKIIYLSPEELTPYENNTRKHTPEDIDGIKKSILAAGFDDPIGIWGEDNIIVEGHGRQIAAMELHLERVPCIRLDHLTDAQRREYAIRHNRSAEKSAWDFSKLEEELAALAIEDVDMSDLGFDGVKDDGFTDDFTLADGDREPVQNMTFTFSDEQAEKVNEAIREMKRSPAFAEYDDPNNKNGNGNALYLVVEEWLQQKM